MRIAYAVFGSHVEAEDVVSECWLKLAAADRVGPVRDVDAWATVAVARAALDTARSARMRREVYPGSWLPEPLIEHMVADDPADEVGLDDTVHYALLVVLESLTPAERTSWVLHDLFGMTFIDVAATVGRTPAAVRRLAARARAHIQARTPRVPVDAAAHAAAVHRFLAAAVGGDIQSLVSALDPDVTVVSDGGGEVWPSANPRSGQGRPFPLRNHAKGERRARHPRRRHRRRSWAGHLRRQPPDHRGRAHRGRRTDRPHRLHPSTGQARGRSTAISTA